MPLPNRRTHRRRVALPADARITPDFRRAVVFGVLAAAAYGVSRGYGVHAARHTDRIVAYSCAGAFVVLALLAVRSAANELARLMSGHAGTAAAASIRVLALIIGYVAVLLLALDVFAVPVGNLLLGGAVTGIILGIAAQQALGSLFAGLVLLITRPYTPGLPIRIVGGSVGALEGTVVAVGLIYTTLDTADGPLNIPNSALLGASIGPAATPPPRPGGVD